MLIYSWCREHSLLGEVFITSWSPVLQVWIQLLHYLQIRTYFLLRSNLVLLKQWSFLPPNGESSWSSLPSFLRNDISKHFSSTMTSSSWRHVTSVHYLFFSLPFSFETLCLWLFYFLLKRKRNEGQMCCKETHSLSILRNSDKIYSEPAQKRFSFQVKITLKLFDTFKMSFPCCSSFGVKPRFHQRNIYNIDHIMDNVQIIFWRLVNFVRAWLSTIVPKRARFFLHKYIRATFNNWPT